jgi:hypothetical protein
MRLGLVSRRPSAERANKRTQPVAHQFTNNSSFGRGVFDYGIAGAATRRRDRMPGGLESGQRPPYALSASSFSQVETPLGLAFRLYSAFSALVQRTWICSVARSLAGRDGLPLPRFGSFMAVIMGYTNNPCNPS